jgi:hypothetical protein
MTFSNPAGPAVAAASGYVRALLDVLGERNPLEVLDELVPWLGERTQRLDESMIRKREAPGKWSVIAAGESLVRPAAGTGRTSQRARSGERHSPSQAYGRARPGASPAGQPHPGCGGAFRVTGSL